jgi:hypothetical protein
MSKDIAGKTLRAKDSGVKPLGKCDGFTLSQNSQNAHPLTTCVTIKLCREKPLNVRADTTNARVATSSQARSLKLSAPTDPQKPATAK